MKILTKHPEGKSGVRISKQKYELVKGSLVDALRSRGDLTYTARGVIQRVEGTRPQKLRLVKP